MASGKRKVESEGKERSGPSLSTFHFPLSTSRRIGCVSFINTKPLIYGLERDPAIQLLPDVPARLLDGLLAGRYEIALLPVIDLLHHPQLRIVPGGCISCDGPTLTVRIFSRVPIESIEELACDTDSHTSVALARVILAQTLGRRPRFVDLDRSRQPNSMLLIGDKVVCEEPAGYPHQLDLGEAWKKFTGLPFVFAAWMAPADMELGDLPHKLDESRRLGEAHIDEIVRTYAVPRGWPAALARKYLTEYLKFPLDVSPNSSQMRAIRRFHQLAGR